jgi:hypothetical protein
MSRPPFLDCANLFALSVPELAPVHATAPPAPPLNVPGKTPLTVPSFGLSPSPPFLERSTIVANMKPELTRRERRMVSLERSYRNERAGAGAVALLTGLPPLAYAIVIAYYRVRLPEASASLPIHWEVFRYSGLPFMVSFFLAYRAQTKLWMIKHLTSG